MGALHNQEAAAIARDQLDTKVGEDAVGAQVVGQAQHTRSHLQAQGHHTIAHVHVGNLHAFAIEAVADLLLRCEGGSGPGQGGGVVDSHHRNGAHQGVRHSTCRVGDAQRNLTHNTARILRGALVGDAAQYRLVGGQGGCTAEGQGTRNKILR